MGLIAVTGASGKLGSSTINYLLERKVRPADIVAVVRDPAKVPKIGLTVRRGDYSDARSLESAFKGIDKLLFVSTTVIGEERMIHHRNVVNAARAGGVRHIVYTSVVKASPDAIFAASPGHFHTEALVRESGIPFTFFRNNLYMDLIPLMFGDAVATGRIVHNAGAGRIGFAARQNISAALAAVLTNGDHANKTYDISAPSPYSLGDIAAALGKASRKTVTYQPVSSDEFRKVLEARSVPAQIVAMSVALGDAIRAGEFDVASTDLGRLMGKPAETLEAFLRRALAPAPTTA
jgi:NAD(P)H dehydrogenase (quinone)